jgi:hypothetical protein
MKGATFTIKGLKPFLFHKFNIEAVTNTKKPKEGSSGNNPSEWKDTVFTEGRRLYIPSFYMQTAITAGGKFVKIGRGTVSKQICSALNILDERLYFNRELPKPIEDMTAEDLGTDSSKPIYIDIRGVSNPNTKGKNIRYRVALNPGWELTANIEWDDTIISTDQMKASIEALGKLVGLSNGRTIGYGRFEVKEFILHSKK